MVNSMYNGWRFEDVGWIGSLSQPALPLRSTAC
jgi:hypothetical protein